MYIVYLHLLQSSFRMLTSAKHPKPFILIKAFHYRCWTKVNYWNERALSRYYVLAGPHQTWEQFPSILTSINRDLCCHLAVNLGMAISDFQLLCTPGPELKIPPILRSVPDSGPELKIHFTSDQLSSSGTLSCSSSHDQVTWLSIKSDQTTVPTQGHQSLRKYIRYLPKQLPHPLVGILRRQCFMLY